MLPVLFFVHGGAFVAGSSANYDCTNLATTNGAVVISTNYRLGALGWMSIPSDGGDGDPPLLANFGLQDQRSALRWAQRELESLGGDPSRVMIYGESAGAMSVMLHAVSPPSAGLFRRVMSESGSPMDTWPVNRPPLN